MWNQKIERAINMKVKENNRIILIPAFEPDINLLTYVRELQQYGLKNIIVVDDGSGEGYKDIFTSLEKCGCVIITNKVNKGKGNALKNGLRYIYENYPYCSCIVTVDSDGQHATEDVYRMVNEAEMHPEGLILGERDFKKPGIPAKSYIGNNLTSYIFALFFGRYFPDTQTGLRAFSPQIIKSLMEISGERFDYETQVLIFCIRNKIPVIEVMIQTIYNNGNKGTHFHPIRDSFKIFIVIISHFIKFISWSIICAAVDLGLAWILFDYFKPLMQGMDFFRIITATVIARVVSLGFNYFFNKKLVFKSNQFRKNTLIRYLILCLINMGLSSVSVYFLHSFFLMDEKEAKLICDLVLFFINYQLQMQWVFAVRGYEK